MPGHYLNMRRLQGFSLIELMIALVLGTLIVLGAVGLFITNQRTFTLQRNMTDIQQQGLFTLGFVRNNLRHLAYQSPDASGSVPFGAAFSNISVNGNTFSASSNGANTASDRLTFTFSGTTDCEGGSVTNETQIAETYWLDGNKLKCKGSLTHQGTTLLSGVTSFQVLYGMDTVHNQHPGVARVSSYVTADVAKTMEASGDQVVAVRVAFVIQKDTGNPQNISSNRTYQLLDQHLQDGQGVLSKTNQVRRQFVVTIPVRNYDWMKI